MIARIVCGMMGLALIVAIASGGAGLYDRQHQPHYVFWNAEGAEVDTASNSDSVRVILYSTQYTGADTAGHANCLTYTVTDSGGGGWYINNPTWDIYLVIRDSFSVIDTLSEYFLIVGRVLGDSVITDTTAFKADVVPAAAIISVAGVTGADEDDVSLADVQSACTNDFHNIGGTDDDVPESGDFGAAGDLEANGTLSTGCVADNEIDYTNVTLADFDYQTPWRVFYSNTDGDVTELALGADGTYLKSNGAAAAPTFEVPSGGGGSDWADSLRLGGTTYDADRWFTDAKIDTANTHDAQWEAYIQAHQSGGAGDMMAADWGDSLVNYDGAGILITDLGDIDILLDVAGGLELVDDSVNVKLDGVSLTLSASGLKITDELTLEELEDYVGAMVSGNSEVGIAVTYDDNAAGRGKLDFQVDSLITREMQIWAPDGINDEIEFLKIDALTYPNGVTLKQVAISLPADAAYSMVFEEWAGDPPVAQNDVETVTTAGTDAYMEVAEGDIDDKNLDADDMLYLHVPNTDVDWIKVMAIFVKD